MDLKRVQMSESIPAQLVTTLFEAPVGYVSVENLGIARGISVRSRNLVALIGACFKAMVGGRIETFRTLCEDSRTEAYNIMVDHAFSIGAGAVLGVRYDATEIADGITEMLCYGTAVKIAKK